MKCIEKGCKKSAERGSNYCKEHQFVGGGIYAMRTRVSGQIQAFKVAKSSTSKETTKPKSASKSEPMARKASAKGKKPPTKKATPRNKRGR